MRIIVCGSMTASKRMVELEEILKGFGHDIVLPEFTHEYAKLTSQDEMHSESVENKIKYDLIRGYFETIKSGNSVLVTNEDTRKDTPFYIGGNSFLEMAFAHVLNKPIYLTGRIPNMIYTEEIMAMKPVELNGDLSCFRR